jgi:hypothetical protein
MKGKKTLNYLLGLLVPLAVLSVGHPVWAYSCSTDNGVTCCGRVYGSSGFCCYTVSCSNGTSSGGCTACVQSRVNDGTQNKDKLKDRMSKKDTIALLKRISLKDKELSRSIRLLLDKPSNI